MPHLQQQSQPSSGTLTDNDQVNKSKEKTVSDEHEVQLLRQTEREDARMALQKNACLQAQPNIFEAGSKSQGTEVEVSSSKALRVAMLKRQFAGTILKAQQTLKSQSQLGGGTTTNQDEVAKFEKEKAKQVAELELEVRRLRQKEREAARMALEKVEQSVDVEDNFRVMREMETLFGCPVAFAQLWCS